MYYQTAINQSYNITHLCLVYTPIVTLYRIHCLLPEYIVPMYYATEMTMNIEQLKKGLLVVYGKLW